jgi:predicted O-methyltransferase YrrM
MLDNVLDSIPDKREDKNTTSLKFKRDLISYLGDDYKDKVCLEIGTSRGYSTKILSHLFKKVITCETNVELLNFAKDVNKDRDNIVFLNKDVYNTSWDFNGIDVVFIDCNHEISYVLIDIKNAISLCRDYKDILIIFDDYGLDNPWEGVKEAIATYDNDERFEIIKEIGEPKGSDCNPRALLRDVEGVICRYSNLHKQTFMRVLDSELYNVGDVYRLGFDKSEGLRIPDEYLEGREFTVMRTCHGIGDWGIISAMPRLLKEKYPDCKVYIPSENILGKLFSQYSENWNAWSNPFKNSINIFKNNPYVDAFVDDIRGEVFHDHYRIYDKNNKDVPLLEQMLEFWQFEKNEYEDSAPELYFSDEEKEMGDKIINEYTDGEFGCLLISDRYDYTMDKLMIDVIDSNLKHFYWTERPIEQTSFSFIDKALDMKNMPVRIQLYIKSKAKYNVSNQCGTSQLLTRYSKVYSVQRQFPIAHNFVRGEKLLTDNTVRNLLEGLPDKTESKTTTSLKFKADFIEFFDKDEYKNMSILEVGSSLGHSTKMLSYLFKKVVALDNLYERHETSKKLNSGSDNIEYVVMDVYNQPWNFKHMDIVFIDCVHDYAHIKSDIDNSLKAFGKGTIIAFDDYGLFPELKQAIDEYVGRGQLKVLKKIGQLKGTFYPTTQFKILKDYEGIICQSV